MKVERDITIRWENGIAHHPKSVELFYALAKIDFSLGGDYFCWKSGGDGDNGEHLMYELDIYFECLETGEQILGYPLPSTPQVKAE